MDRSMEHWRKQSDQVAPEKQFAQIVETYLSALHRDNPGHGCSIPALGAEIARESPKTRRAFAGKLDEMIDMLTGFIPNMPRKAARKQAIATLATMAGTMLLARIAGSSELSDEVLKAGKDSALEGSKREPKATAVKKRQD
jgi:TetR/AcrR family transcriptional repressor of nem operon